MTYSDHPRHRLRAFRVHHPRALRWLVHLSVPGVFVLAAVDFSLIPLPVPNATDLLLLWLSAHRESPWFLVPAALAGSLLGAYSTWHVAHKGGRRLLRRYSSVPLVKPLSAWMERHPIVAALGFPMLPPPFPLTAFVLAAGTLGVAPRRFFAAFAASLSVRYILLAWLGITCGRRIVRLWTEAIRRWSASFLWILAALLVVAIGMACWHTWARRRSLSREMLPTGSAESSVD